MTPKRILVIVAAVLAVLTFCVAIPLAIPLLVLCAAMLIS